MGEQTMHEMRIGPPPPVPSQNSALFGAGLPREDADIQRLLDADHDRSQDVEELKLRLDSLEAETKGHMEQTRLQHSRIDDTVQQLKAAKASTKGQWTPMRNQH